MGGGGVGGAGGHLEVEVGGVVCCHLAGGRRRLVEAIESFGGAVWFECRRKCQVEVEIAIETTMGQLSKQAKEFE